jgi:UrcA family protein
MWRRLTMRMAAVSLLGWWATMPVAQAGPEQAGREKESLPSVAVHYRAQELLDDAGIARVYARLREAARSVCRGYESSQLALQAAFRQCVSLSLDRAVLQIHDPGLAAYHQHKLHALPVIAAVHAGPR